MSASQKLMGNTVSDVNEIKEVNNKIDIWQTVKEGKYLELDNFLQKNNFDLRSIHPDKKDSGQTLLHFAVELGKHGCCQIIAYHINRQKLENLFISKQNMSDKVFWTPAEIAFNYTDEKDPIYSPTHLACFKTLMSASLVSAKECERILRENLPNFPKHYHALDQVLHYDSMHIERCTFVMKFRDMLPLVVQPQSSFFYHLCYRKTVKTEELARHITLVQKIEENELKEDDLDFTDLEIQNFEGRSLIEIANENNSDDALKILMVKKQEQGFANHLSALDHEELYLLVMSLDSDKDIDFIKFLSSDYQIAEKTRLVLCMWILQNVINGKLIKTLSHEREKAIKILTLIYQNDKRTFEYGDQLATCLHAFLDIMQKISSKSKHNKQSFINADEAFKQATNNELKGSVLKYANNIELLNLFKDKILSIKDSSDRMKCYILLFNLNNNSIKSDLHVIFYHGNSGITKERNKILAILKEDYIQLLKQQEEAIAAKEKQKEQDRAFAKGVGKLIQLKSKSDSYKHEQKLVPLTSIKQNNGKTPAFFQTTDKETFDVPSEENDQDEFDEQIANIKLR